MDDEYEWLRELVAAAGDPEAVGVPGELLLDDFYGAWAGERDGAPAVPEAGSAAEPQPEEPQTGRAAGHDAPAAHEEATVDAATGPIGEAEEPAAESAPDDGSEAPAW